MKRCLTPFFLSSEGVNAASHALGGEDIAPSIPDPNWAHNAIIDEDPTEQIVSKAMAGQAAFTLLTVGAGSALGAVRCAKYGNAARLALQGTEAAIATKSMLSGGGQIHSGIKKAARGKYLEAAVDLGLGGLNVALGIAGIKGLLAGGCFTAGTLVLTNQGSKAIEAVRLGQRIPTQPAGVQETIQPKIDPAEYRVIRLNYSDPKLSEPLALAFLRPASHVMGLKAGDTISLEILELEADGPATVMAIEPSPAIDEGPGELVTGTMTNRNFDLRLVKLEGLDKPIEVTASHPIFSEDRGDFVPVGELRTGERLRTRTGVAVVEAIVRLAGEHQVFNLEINDVHRYYVSELDVLVHNACGGLPSEAEMQAQLKDQLLEEGEVAGNPYAHLQDSSSVGPGKAFTAAQKNNILAENRASNGGILRDDVTGEELVPSEQCEAGVTPPSNAAQVDHVDPKSLGGPNSYANAKVRSRANNIAKSNKW